MWNGRLVIASEPPPPGLAEGDGDGELPGPVLGLAEGLGEGDGLGDGDGLATGEMFAVGLVLEVHAADNSSRLATAVRTRHPLIWRCAV